MKKLGLTLCLFVAGCLNAGSVDVLSERNNIFYAINGYSIKDYDGGGVKLVNTEKVEEINFKTNQAQTVSRGESVLTNKVYIKEYYAKEFFKANKTGVLNSSSMPVIIKADTQYSVEGVVKIDGIEYKLLPTGLEGYKILMTDDGSLYSRIGQVKDGYLILLDTEFFPYPSDLKIEKMTSSYSEQSESVTGFDVRYDGVRLDRIWFTYMDYSQPEGGKFQNLSFPNKPGLININNIGFRVLKADDDKITYMVLTSY